MALPMTRRRRLEKVLLAEYAKLYRLAWSWCHDRHGADDLVQETCLRAMERLSQLKDGEKTLAWVVKIMVNLHRDRIRARKETLDVERLHLVSSDSVEGLAHQAESVDRVRRAVATLDRDHRHVLTLVDLMQFSYAEVAETLDIPMGTVMSRLSRARGKLKDVLLRQESQASGQPRLRMVK